jgi:hypothetical protein
VNTDRNRNRIVARKNKGILILEKLDKGLYTEDVFKHGDSYVYMKGNRVLNWSSMSSRDQEVAKVIWYYNVGDKKKVICMYDKTMEEMINEYRPLYEKHDINRVL